MFPYVSQVSPYWDNLKEIHSEIFRFVDCEFLEDTVLDMGQYPRNAELKFVFFIQSLA